MATYVLVHGAFSGAQTWRKVRPILREAGHEVFTPSLTGLGERVHLASPQVTLTTHIQDVVNLVLFEDLRDIVLLGFSYGGMVVTGSLEYIADRVKHLVYLDAIVPKDGQSAYSINGTVVDDEFTKNWLIPPVPRDFDDPEEGAWAEPRRTPQPRNTLTEPVRLAKPLEEYSFTRTYIKALVPPRDAGGNQNFWLLADHAKASPAWRYGEVDTNHMIPNNRPAELARMLLELA